MKEIYLYSEKKIYNIINEMFTGYEIQIISADKIKKNNFINNNILLVVDWVFLKDINILPVSARFFISLIDKIDDINIKKFLLYRSISRVLLFLKDIKQ